MADYSPSGNLTTFLIHIVPFYKVMCTFSFLICLFIQPSWLCWMISLFVLWINVFFKLRDYCVLFTVSCISLLVHLVVTLAVEVECRLDLGEMARSFVTLNLVCGCISQSGISVACRSSRSSSTTNIQQLLIVPL